MENLNKVSLLIFLLVANLTTYMSSAQTSPTISGANAVCVGDVSIYSLNSLVPGATYTWSVGAEGNVLNNGSSATIQWNTIGNTTIVVQGEDPSGTPVAQAAFDVSINDIPQPTILPTSYVTCALEDTIRVDEGICVLVCENNEVTYTVTNIVGATYDWSVNGETSFTTSGNSCTVLWGDIGFGNVSVEVIQGNCIGIDLLCVEIIESPEALFATQPEYSQQNTLDVCLNSSILFTNLSSDSNESPIISWAWDFDDGTFMYNGIGSENNPVEHSYSQAGSYKVTLVVTNSCGCTDSFFIYVNVSQDPGIQIECPSVVCENEEVEYTVDNPTCNLSGWDVIGGQILSQNHQNATVIWNNVDEFGFGYIIYSNECNPCPGKTIVKVPVITQNSTIQGPENVCPNTVYSYSMPQWPSTKYQWSLSGDVTFVSGEPQNVLTLLSGAEGSFQFDVSACNLLLNCFSVDTKTVTISPQASIVGNQNLCINSTSEYTLLNASSASWTLTSPTGVETAYNGQVSVNPTFNEAGVYSLEIVGDFCSPDIFQINVYNKPPAPIEILGPDSICNGVPTLYTASPQLTGITTQWFLISGNATPTSGASSNITLNSLPGFFVTFNMRTDVEFCYSTPVLKTIYPIYPSSISITTDAPSNLTVCGSSQWEFGVDYTDGNLYQWEIMDPAMGSIVAGNNSPNIEVLFNNPLTNSEDVDVIVAVTKCNQILRDTITIQVINTPDYTVTPGATTVCAEEELTFTISPTPSGYESLTWDFGDGFASDQPNPTHMYANNTSLAQFNPTLTIVNPEGCLVTSVIQAGPISVKPAPVALLSPVSNFIACGPFTLALSATVSTGFGSTTNYEWFGPPTSPTPPNCSNCNTWSVSQFGEYEVVVENSNGCQGVSNTVTISENCSQSDCPSLTIVQADSSFVSCARVQATIEYDATGLNVIGENWVFPDEAILTTSTTGLIGTATASFEEAGVYPMTYVVAHDGCLTKIFQYVYVPFVGDMRYSVTCGSGSFYDITMFDHSNIFQSEEGQIDYSYFYRSNGVGPWQQVLAPNSALSVTFQLGAGDYELMEVISSNITTAAPACSTIVNVNLTDKPDADFEINSPYEPACINDVVVNFNNLSTPGTGLNFLWDFDEGPTNFQSNPNKVFSNITPSIKEINLVATNSIGCRDSIQKSIQIEDNGLWDGTNKPDLLTNPTPPTCIGNPINLTYFDLTFQTPPNFTWYQENAPITPLVTASSLDVTQGGEYWVMGSDQYGCLVPSDPATVFFTPIQTPTIIGSPAQCDSIPFTLTSSVNTTTEISLEWERNPGGVVGTGNVIVETLEVGTYVYTLTATQNGCVGVSVPYTVTVTSPVDTPSVSFNITSCQPYVVELTATNAQSGTYNWSNGATGSTVDGFTGGLYEVFFTANSGCESKNQIEIPKSPQEYMWIFPTGCFCTDYLNDNSPGVCSQQPLVYTTLTSFAFWSYQINGVDAYSGTNSAPYPFGNLTPDSINLVLDNGFCQVVSDAMYINENCSGSGQQSIAANGDSSNGINSQLPGMMQGDEEMEPEIFLLPNPASNQTQIQYRFDGSETRKSIEVYDMTGRKIKELRPQNEAGIITLQLGDVVGGIYEICLRQNGRVLAQSKLSVTP